MKTNLRIGYWEHWFKLDYHIGTFLKEKFNCSVERVDYSKKNYYETVDVLIVSQSGVNDYLENDRDRLHDFVRNGGICWIMHQDWRRYNPCFLPEEAGRPLLVQRYCATLGGKFHSMTYLQPWIEEPGRKLFCVPNEITSDEMVYWELDADSFEAIGMHDAPTRTCSAATAAMTNVEKWEVLGSFMDAGMPENSALVMQHRYGKGLFLWNQILFPERRPADANDRVLKFWERYCENALNYFEAFRKGEEITPPAPPAKNIAAGNAWKKTITHIHTLDWYAADHTLADLNAAMRYLKFDAAVLGFKDALSYHDNPDYDKYSDDKVTLIPGMEYHPFNFQNPISQNAYHMLAMGVRSCYNKFTRSLFDDADVDEYIRTALEHIRKEGGASCATHPDDQYWRNYDFDAVDIYDWDYARRGDEIEDRPFSENAVQKAWMEGSHITLMASVDMWGIARLRANPVCNFICYQGDITRENLVKAVKAGHVMPAFNVDSAAVSLGEYLPGDTVPAEALKAGLKCAFTAEGDLTELRLWGGDKILSAETLPAGTHSVERVFDLTEYKDVPYFHLELRGKKSHLISNPFFVK